MSNDMFAYMKDYIRQNKIPLGTLFNQFDKDGNGVISTTELRPFLKKMLPWHASLSEKDVRHFQVMVDTSGDGAISLIELKAALNSSIAVSHQVHSKESEGKGDFAVGWEDVLILFAQYFESHHTKVEKVFERLDTKRRGSLDQNGIRKFLKIVVPALNNKEVRYLMAHLHAVDSDGDGRLSLRELKEGLKKIIEKKPVTSDAAPGLSSPSQDSSSSSSSSEQACAREAIRAVTEASMEPTDESPPPQASPAQSSKSATRAAPPPPSTTNLAPPRTKKLAEMDMMAALYHYLARRNWDYDRVLHSLLLTAVFKQFDTNGDGLLKIQELVAFAAKIKPTATMQEISTMKRSLDTNHDSVVTIQELKIGLERYAATHPDFLQPTDQQQPRSLPEKPSQVPASPPSHQKSPAPPEASPHPAPPSQEATRSSAQEARPERPVQANLPPAAVPPPTLQKALHKVQQLVPHSTWQELEGAIQLILHQTNRLTDENARLIQRNEKLTQMLSA
ncbi:hypothetical protein CYMTET_48054 [Cymbomonas tetramitiformis]|uniref:EF-hand domain-containing protein n=1 Tax=Cymbomonas tetramitiformis TaxID=36881 RepID=A0AAE0BT04_9CHLO|nr:hypothetical protein CYMTET_48054 [Cymbomonas tetramitiformis]